MVRGDDAVHGGSMQGIYIFAPSGELLARRNSTNPDVIAGIIDQALVKWESLPDDRRTLADASQVTPEFRWTDSYPVGGLVLRRSVRDLPETDDPAHDRAKRFNRDAVWFTPAEARLWLPQYLEVGATREVPAVIVNRLAQFVLVDNAQGQTIPYHVSEVGSSSLTVQIDAVDESLVDIQINGATSAVAQGPWLLGENYWKPKHEYPHSIATSIYGTATFDRAQGVFVSFDVLALGEREGRTVMNGRRADDESGAIGFVLELAPPKWRVAPTFINMYDADWVKQPPEATASKTEVRDSDEPVAYRRHVQQCLDTLIQHGTDRYGEVESPLLMAVLDINRRQSPQAPELYDSLIRTEDRLHRRGERGTNLWYDQNVLRAMYRLTDVTGEPRFAQAADAYLRYALDVCVKPNGLLVWGTHIYWDCFADRAGGDQDGAGPHEILIHLPAWEAMYRVNPEAIRREVDGIWQWHIIDHETGLHNRHDDQQRGCDFVFSGGSFALAFASMYHLTNEAVYLERARTVANWHWRHRDPMTGLVADAPGLPGRYDGRHSFTSVTGPFASQLLRCYELTGDAPFRDMAIAYIKAYEKYGWDDDARSYWGMLALDGTPVPQAEQGAGYDRYQPTGHVDVWRTIMFSYEFPLVAAQASVYAYEMTRSNAVDGDPELLAIALHWAEVIERNLPAQTGARWKHELEQAIPGVRETGGTYAENYGRAISFFVHLYRATGDAKYLELAEGIGREAIDKLFDKGLFKGHPAKPYYETVDGVGLLLYALLELDSPQVNIGGAF